MNPFATKNSENLVIVISAIAFFIASWAVANVDIGSGVTWISAIFIIALAIPSYRYLDKWLGHRHALLIIIIFSIFPVIVEVIGISTGLPYGTFYYTDEMGFKILGLVPWSVMFAFSPLIFGSYALAAQITNDLRFKFIISAALLVIFDLILDPAAVWLNIWVWDTPGPYYGIPISNYTGWFLTAFIASVLMHFLITLGNPKTNEVPPKLTASLFLSVSFWTGFSIWTELLIPALIGIIMSGITLFYFIQPTIDG